MHVINMVNVQQILENVIVIKDMLVKHVKFIVYLMEIVTEERVNVIKIFLVLVVQVIQKKMDLVQVTRCAIKDVQMDRQATPVVGCTMTANILTNVAVIVGVKVNFLVPYAMTHV